jgi:hypothetical protein
MEQPRQPAGIAPQAPGQPPRRPRQDRWVRLAFVAATLIVIAAIYYKQRVGFSLPGWGSDLSAALAQAKAEDRPVLAFFVSSPPDETSRWLVGNTIPKNAQAIDQGKFIKVLVKVGNLSKSQDALRYRVTNMPTMLVIGPDGAEKNRREGTIGELEFRNGFLDCMQVIGPSRPNPP